MTTRRQRLQGPALTREAALPDNAIIDPEARIIRASFSSEEPVLRQSFFADPWVEILGHGNDEVDLSRMLASAPVLYNHSRYDSSKRIGVVERAWLEGGRGHAQIRISKRPEVDGLWQDIQDGVLRNVSVGYRIHERKLQQEEKGAPDIYRVIRWEPMEISMVDIPADPTVGVGRSEEPTTYHITDIDDDEENAMPRNTEAQRTEPPTVGQDSQQSAHDIDQERQAAAAQARQEAMEAERTRRTDIRQVFEAFQARPNIRAVMDACLDDYAVTTDQARAQLLDALGKSVEPAGDPMARITVGESDSERFARGAEAALLARAGLGQGDAGNEFRGYTLLELARRSLSLHHVRMERYDKIEVVGRAFTHSSNDFTNLLANIANKAMLMGWDEAPETFDQWTRIGNLPDFKQSKRVDLNLFPSLSEVPEGAEYKYATLGDRGETIQLATYGRLFSITRQAVINDDLDAFTRIPNRMARAARRTVGNLVYAVLTDNAAMSDGTALFHANHANLAAAGAAPSTATFDAARTAMGTQKDPDSHAVALNISPAYAVVPKALEGSARVVVDSETEIAASQNNSRRPNSVRGMVAVIADARLDASSTTAYYFAANQNQWDTIEVAYLDGMQGPRLEQQTGWLVDGTEFKVAIDAGVSPLDFRTLYKDPGA